MVSSSVLARALKAPAARAHTRREPGQAVKLNKDVLLLPLLTSISVELGPDAALAFSSLTLFEQRSPPFMPPTRAATACGRPYTRCACRYCGSARALRVHKRASREERPRC